MAFVIPENLKSRSDVPNAVQRVASALQIGLDDSATVWYEPLYDPKKEKPHLVVLLPMHGIVVLEILELKVSGILGSLRGRLRISRDGQELEVENPLVRAERLANTLKERISLEKRLSEIVIPVSSGAVYPGITEQQLTQKGIAGFVQKDRCVFGDVIDKALKGEGEDQLYRVFAKMLKTTLTGTIAPEKEKILRGIIQPDIVIDRAIAANTGSQIPIFRPPEGGEDVVRVMDRHQEAVAKSLGSGHRVIRGVAGSGKTLILVFRAKLLARNFPQNKILVTCFTRSLASQLREMLKEQNNVTVMHLDGLMAEIIRLAGVHHPGYENDDQGEQVAQIALSAQSKVKSVRFDAVLLDEAQDFGTTALKFALGLLKEGREDFVIVADAAQNIFRRRFSWKTAGIQAQGRSNILRVNYRNTKEILEFASRFLMASSDLKLEDLPDPEDEKALVPPESAARSGPKPIVRLCADTRSEVASTIQQVKTWLGNNKGPRQLAVTYVGAKGQDFDRAKSLHDGLVSNGIGVFWITDPNDPSARDKLAHSNEPVVLSTVYSLKGLEFPYVAICGLSSESKDKNDLQKLAYVGMTRATDHLAVIARKGHPIIELIDSATYSS